MTTLSRETHICLVIRGLGGRSGGAERVYCELANMLAQSGYRVTCLYFDTKDRDPFYHIDSAVQRINLYGPPRQEVKRKAFVSKYLWPSGRDQAEWDLANDVFVSRLRDYFTLVKPKIAISLLPPANTPTLVAAAGTSVKVIACNHNVPKEDYTNPGRWSPNPIDRALRLKSLDEAAAIHVLFPDFGTWFPAHLQSRIVAIPNCISPDFRDRDPLPEREKTILAVGRLAEVKNYMQLIKSWATLADEFPDWKAKIFGIGPQLKEINESISRLNLAGRVELPGHVSDLSLEYAKASFFCHPALFEGFGLSPAEALYMGTPVVAYEDCLGVNQFVKDRLNGILVKRGGDRDHLADALRQLITDKTLRETLGSRGRESVREFTIEEYRSRWTSLIERVGRN